MSFAIASRTWISTATLALCGCYAPAQRHVTDVAPMSLDVVADAPANVRFDPDSTVHYAKVRLVGDTLYGWEFQERRSPRDSVAIALHRIRGIEQDRFDAVGTLGAVVACVMGSVALGFVALFILLHNDRS